jgi:hypothetical protein
MRWPHVLRDGVCDRPVDRGLVTVSMQRYMYEMTCINHISHHSPITQPAEFAVPMQPRTKHLQRLSVPRVRCKGAGRLGVC